MLIKINFVEKKDLNKALNILNTYQTFKVLLEEKTSEWLKHSFVHLSDGKDLLEAAREAVHPSQERLEHLKKDKNYIYSYTDGKSALRFKQVIEDLLLARDKYAG